MMFSKKVYEAEALPSFYGFTYHDWCFGYTIAHPIPFNLIIRFGRWLYLQIIKMRPLAQDREFRKAWLAGRVQGLKSCHLIMGKQNERSRE